MLVSKLSAGVLDTIDVGTLGLLRGGCKVDESAKHNGECKNNRGRTHAPAGRDNHGKLDAGWETVKCVCPVDKLMESGPVAQMDRAAVS